MRFVHLLAAATVAVAALAAPAAHAAPATKAPCNSTSLSNASLAASPGTRTTALGSDFVSVAGATDVAVLCQYQYTPDYQKDSSFNVAFTRICVGINVCNGKSGWICVGIDVCNGNRPSDDVCVGVDVCNQYKNGAVMATDRATFRADQGQPVFLCSVVQWRDKTGASYYTAWDTNEQQPGTQCALDSVA
jgi:hypothetical protein